MALSIFLALVLALQGGMAKALHPWVKRGWWRWLNWSLLALNLPMLLYVGLRTTGAPTSATLFLRPFARVGLYLQILAILVILWSGLTELAWWLRGRISRREETPENPGRRAFLRTSGLLGLGTAAATATTGTREAYGDPQITRLRLPFPDLPQGLDGLRLAFLSDLHAGPLIGAGLLRRWRELAERERPDLLLFGGDFVDSLPHELGPLITAFEGFRPALGTFAVLGNHDYFEDPRPIWRDLSANGIRPIENAHALIERNGARLGLIGLQDPMARNGKFNRVPFGPGPEPGAAAAGVPPDAFRLCLAHRPTMVHDALATGARLVLSGHTHGGQINLIPGISSARILGPYTGGLYEVGAARLFVGRGLGVVGLPFRIQAPPEIAIITLARS
jgi:predicted MPP superfamily phosphohydrolase